jgi:molybdopterin-synthase adenylyltransferase
MDDAQLLRYSRHIFLPEIGIEGQMRLQSSRILVVGMGGLGSAAAFYLAAAGVGELHLCDKDEVELSNLQRQIVHTTLAIGERKVISAQRTLSALNPLIHIKPLHTTTCDQWDLKNIDVVLDCTDNRETRLALNAACLREKVALVSGAAIRFEGQISVFRHDQENTPCYCCIYPHAAEAETCSQNGVFTPIVGLVGSLQALEALKLILHVGENLIGRLLLIDALHMDFCTIQMNKNPYCPVCSSS